ncbi:MAG: ParB N-terminal domain-containing protein [Phycisphaerales bacterium]|nr:ParB N-terminal domain-containing protein [Phycisphaerales bacterium]
MHKLRPIEIDLIVPNPGNPRGIDIQSDDEKLSYLKDSIERFGVMVPIVVTPRGEKFLLIDGERRYYAAKAVGLEKLPAYIVTDESGDALHGKDLLFRMFQIHHLREQWGPVQQCAALESVYNKIAKSSKIAATDDPRQKLKRAVEQLASETGIDERTASDRVKFLRWPKDVKDRLYDKADEPGYSYILEIEDKIILPSLANYPEYFETVDVDDVRRDLFKKLEHGLAAAQEVRKVAPFFRAQLSLPSERKALLSAFKKIQKDEALTYDDAAAMLTKALPRVQQRTALTPRRLLTMMGGLQFDLTEFDVSAIPTAKGRARVSQDEIKQSVTSLKDALEDFSKRLREPEP